MADLARAHYAHVAGLLGRLRPYSAAVLDVASRMEKGEPLPEWDTRRFILRTGGTSGRSWLAPLRDNLSPESVIFRHALRLGITATVATALGEGLGLNHWYWVTLTVIVGLQPYAGFTLQKGCGAWPGRCWAAGWRWGWWPWCTASPSCSSRPSCCSSVCPSA